MTPYTLQTHKHKNLPAFLLNQYCKCGSMLLPGGKKKESDLRVIFPALTCIESLLHYKHKSPCHFLGIKIPYVKIRVAPQIIFVILSFTTF